MKKIIYIICSMILVITACDPMDNVYEELDALPKDPSTIKNFDITLSKENYESLKGKPNVPSYVNEGLYFTSEEQAGSLIPLFLNTNYPQLDNGDVINVTYNASTFIYSNNIVSEQISYTLLNTDYVLGGTTFTNFDRWSQIETFLKAKYPSPLEGRLVTLTFTWFNNNTTPTSKTVTDTYYYKNGVWQDTYYVSASDYLSVDRNRNNAFTSTDEALLPDFFNKFLKSNIVGATAGTVQYVSYFVRLSATSTPQYVMAMVYDGNNWSKIVKTLTGTKTLTFVKKDGAWAPDLTIRYTLATADYEWISNNPAIGTEANRANLRSFKNFYQVGSGTDTRYWTPEQIYAGLSALLKDRFPNAPEDQKYLLSYIVYRGSNNTDQTTFIKDASGNYVFFQ